MITLTISASGQVQAFCEASGPEDRGYYLDVPADGDGFKRELYKALVRRQSRFNHANPLEAVDQTAILQWLTDNPPSAGAKPLPAGRKASKPTASLTDLQELKL